MASTTPLAEPPSTTRIQRTRSKSPGNRISRPTTPLRPSSRSSVSRGRAPYSSSTNPLEDLQDGFAELSDAMADLEQNFAQLQLMHESLARFSESFASFLYGLNMNAFCVDFPEAPVSESFRRPLHNPDAQFRTSQGAGEVPDVEATFLTTDTSFVENPPSSKVANKFQNPVTPAPKKPTTRGRGGIPRAGARGGGIPTRGGASRGTSGSGIARGRGGRTRGGA